jgi:16S rRNA (cytosine1402-N4)-methyltransferase
MILTMQKIHKPVLLDESIDSLDIKPDGFYIDCTLGDGGHSFEIHQKLSSKGLLVSIDQDINAINFVKGFYKDTFPNDNWKLEHSNFSKIEKVAEKYNRKPDGILMDLGLSSRQLEESHERGFSYLEDNEPLDMRMDTRLGVKASDLLKVLTVKDLAEIFSRYGEERQAYRIAKMIKKSDTPIETVGDLTRLIYKVMPADKSKKNPSRRVFQALRIVVNDELGSLQDGLDKSFEILNSNGRLSVITFHSLEDRIVKNFFSKTEESGKGSLLFKKYIAPTDIEKEQNPRSASSKLRTIIKN